ncbi:hypothetical protein D927_01449 [Enterococcus faecalis 02-MB-BW-10]|nr:hypothetical protein D927_01449 [Enterococcus faecalis 02-MB-BW-10]
MDLELITTAIFCTDVLVTPYIRFSKTARRLFAALRTPQTN